MLAFLTPLFLILQHTIAAPVTNAPAATIGKIRAVQSPVFHFYLQANSKNSNTFFPLSPSCPITYRLIIS